MSKFNMITCFVTAAAVTLVALAPAHAQTRTWVSGVGDDVNPCSRTAPCKTFAGAISKTAVNGEINCLDPGGFGAVTITKSITIDCHEVFGSILAAGTNGVNVAFNSFAATDTFKTVRLRNLVINGASTGLVGINITGGSTIAGGTLFIEDTLIDGFFAGNARGISDARTAGGEIYISNTTVRDAGGSGIIIEPSSGSTTITAALDNVRSQNSGTGLAVGGGGRVMVFRSIFSGNSGAGVLASVSAGTAVVMLDQTTTSNNNIGIQTGAGGTINLANTNIAFNNTGVTSTGTVQSFGNNRIIGNTSAGITPTLIGAATSDHGQQ